jgi:hypothetical protein
LPQQLNLAMIQKFRFIVALQSFLEARRCPPAEAEREQVQRAPDPEMVTAPSHAAAPIVRPNIHRPQ